MKHGEQQPDERPSDWLANHVPDRPATQVDRDPRAGAAIAAGFAALGQWQLARSVEGGTVSGAESEVPVPSRAWPRRTHRSRRICRSGSSSRSTLTFVPGDSVILVDRLIESNRGSWAVAHAKPATARASPSPGWAADEDAAAAAIAEFESSTPSQPTPVSGGPYLQSESPQQSDFEAGTRTALSGSRSSSTCGLMLLTGCTAATSCSTKRRPGSRPSRPRRRIARCRCNLLNVFYAIEWVIFGGFAAFLAVAPRARRVREKEHGVRQARVAGRADGSPGRATVD